MAIHYTGYKLYTTLKRVSDDVNEYPLDENGNRITESGLPQETKPNNSLDPDYIGPIYDVICL